ncbi:MAG: DUF5711 family protein [Butyribacter sp.]|nr:DUF5711 family protein [bacterium]MDY3853745.1 DUF5711 family protein [Butyribacter sp.]
MESLIGRSFDVMAVKEQHRKRITFLVSAVICILICAVVFYLLFHWFINRQYDSYEVVQAVSVKNGSSQNYVSYADGVIRYGRDGVTTVDNKGTSLWSGSYDMVNPKIDTCQSSAVIADIGGKSLYVYKGDDTGTDFSVDYPIVQACVSRQGVIAVMWEESASNTIAIYNPFDQSNKLLAEIPTNVEDGYPVCMDLSPDGSSIAVSYLCVTSGAAQSRVTFYNFSEVGKNANCLVGAHNYNETVISEIRFLDEDNVCLFGEKGFYIWNNMKQPKAVAKKTFSETIKSAFCNEDVVGMILDAGEEKAQMILYDTEGKKKLSQKVDADYTSVQICEDEILLNSATKCVVYRTNGVKKFSKNLSSKISYFFPGQKTNRYFLIQDSKIKTIKLK